MNYVVCALYKFIALNDYKELKNIFLIKMKELDIVGTLLLAKEGINGTVAGNRNAIDAMMRFLRQDERLFDIEVKESISEKQPFKRTRVKLKKEIVTMGVESIDPKTIVGTYVQPKDWNELISNPDVVVIDTRNDYEVEVGTFQKALNPETKTFREFPSYVKRELNSKQHKKVAMFCTGGIRCEKSTAFLKDQGFEEVYHLQGGILKYLEEVSPEDSLWEGECFVFDDRVTVDHQLNKGRYDQCHACRLPITEVQKKSQYYQKGVSCPRCFDKHTELQKKRFLEREKQMFLAETRDEVHLGQKVNEVVVKRRQQKKSIKIQQNALI